MAPTTRLQKRQTPPILCTNVHGNRLSRLCCSIWNTYVEHDCLMDDQQLKRLGEHKYSAQDSSFLDEYCMKKFWDRVVTKYPLWLAPNLITLVGLIINVIAVLTLAVYTPDAKQVAPRWCYLLCAVGLFLYQTLDATDGKQARRTNSASPLGELFDHGCDSATQVFICLEVCLSLLLGHHHGAVVYVCAVAIGLFYCAHWQTYCTGVLKFERFDVTEAQMSVILFCLFTSFVGPEFWLMELPGLGVPLNLALIAGCTLLAVLQAYYYLSTVLSGGVGKNGSTVADTSVLFPVAPLLAVIVPFLMIYFKSTSGVFDDNIVLFCVTFGFVSSKICNRLVIAHMSKSAIELWDSIYIAPILLMFNQYCDNALPELYVLYAAALYALVNLLLNCILVCRQFCWHLNIECFRIPAPNRE